MHTIKAQIGPSGEWHLWVLGAPFGDARTKDKHGEYFDARTDFASDRWPLPPAVYYHGYDRPGVESPTPHYIGKSIKREERPDGVWFLVELDQSNPYASRVWQGALKSKAAASPGTAYHLIRRDRDGHLKHWPILELSIFETGTGKSPINPRAVALPALKAIYDEAGIILPAFNTEPNDKGAAAQRSARSADQSNHKEPSTMDEEEIKALIKSAVNSAVGEGVAAALQARDNATKAETERQAAIDAEVERRLEEERTKAAKAESVNRRLPFNGQAPHQTQFADTNKFDNLPLVDQAFLVQTLNAAYAGRVSKHGVSEGAIKALVIKASEDQSNLGNQTRNAIKAAAPHLNLNAIKADELNRTDLASYGDEWAATAWSNNLWEKIRISTPVLQQIPTIEIPEGVNSLTIPIDGTSFTFYKVPEAANLNATTGRPDATITSSKKGTLNKTLTPKKLGARGVWSGEMEEDSIIPWVAMLRMDMEREGAEVIESAIIDGDTATGATTNINDIGNLGAQSGTEYYLMWDGFRKLALVTNTANSRDAGVLALDDYLLTMQLLGPSGINALDRAQCFFWVDPSVYFKSLNLTQVMTRDLFVTPTIEGGQLTAIYGYPLLLTANAARKSAVRLSNTSGKVDQTTPANNTKGSLGAVRKDQWLFGNKRRTTMEVTRYPEADANQIVTLMRADLIYRDNEASSLSYNITV